MTKSKFVQYELHTICEFISGLWKGKKGPLTKFRVIRNTNFSKDGALSLDDVAEIDVEMKGLEKKILRKGDLILEKSGGGPKQPVGRVVLFNLDEENFSFSNFTTVIRILDKELVNPKFLWRYLVFLYKTGYTARIQSNTTGIRNLDFKAYKSIKIPLPSQDEQIRIVATFDEIDELRNNQQESLEKSNTLFDVMLHKEFYKTI
jgi:type I restriction enzyme S subunit